ncbi:MAG TPA: zf-HC2 domain-containing protein [Candidatus Limnocylindria bacterium]|nr:zf-HC2 domain-containing protein [Candidatus Limnocylindria bacterium]
MGRPHLSIDELSAHADGELAADIARSASEHLFSCASCRSAFESFQRFDAELRRPPLVGCATALPLISARLDAEVNEAEAALAERHLETCAGCRRTEAVWSAARTALVALPAARPSARVDAAIAALVRPAPRRRRVPVFAARALISATAALAIVITMLPRAGAPITSLEGSTERVFVAAAQQIVLNPRTNTLYILDPAAAAVVARDAGTNALKARIDVGGRPTALALNESANMVLVLDASQKSVTEIDGATNRVIGSTAVAVTGTPTSIAVDPAGGKIVVTTEASTNATGSVTVLDGATKKVETVREFAAVPRSMVFAPSGDRAALVSTAGTTIVDASYREIATLPGGVGAAFAQGDDRIAILSATASGSVVTYSGRAAPAGLALAGTPRAIVSLPDGGFLVLVSMGERSRVSYLAPDGHEAGRVELGASGTDLVYDAAARRFSVVGAGALAWSEVPQTLAASSPTPTADVAAASPSPAPPASAAPSPSASATPAPSTSPSAAPVASPTPDALSQAAAVSAGFVHVDLPGGRQPVFVSKSGERLWVLNDRGGVVTVDMSTAEMFSPASLPVGAQISHWAAGRAHVYAVDTTSGQLHVVDARRERVSSYALKFLKPVSSVAVGLDDRLWIGLRGASYLLAFDPRTGRLDSFDLAGALVSMLTVDGSGRILYADDARGTVGTYDPGTARVSEVYFPRRGTATGLVVDGSSTLWLSTSTGEIFSVRGGVATLALGLQRPVTTLSLDGSGRAWYLAPLPSGAVGFGYAAADGARAGQTIAGAASSLAFNALGRAWLADPLGGFYVSRGAQ